MVGLCMSFHAKFFIFGGVFLKNLFKVLMSVLLVLSGFAGVATTKANAATDSSLVLSSQLNDWVLDANNIYAITDDGNLLEISRSTFQITNTLPLETTSGLSDLALAGTTLYVAMKDQNKVAEIDLTTFTKTKTYSLSQSPYSIALVDGTLYYAYDQFSDIGAINLSTGAESFLSITDANNNSVTNFDSPELASNESGILYVGETGSSGSNIYKISLSTNSVVSESTYDSGYGFEYPERKVLPDNNDVFYAGKSLSKTNLAVINGTYKSDAYEETVLAVTDQFVFTNIGIYDRDEYRKVSNYNLPDSSFSETSFVLAPSVSEVYVFDDNNMTIYKESYSLPTTLPTQTYTIANQKLPLNDDITDWVADDTNGKIYAISQSANKLLTIDMATMAVTQEQSIGSAPSDIDLVSGKLYIADFGGTTITVVDLSTGAQSKITTTQNPYRIATDGNSLFYVTEDQWSDVYKIDLSTSSEVVVGAGLQTNAYEFYEPDLEYDAPNNTLYIAESANSGSTLYALDTSDLVTLRQTDYDSGYGFPYPKRKVVLDGTNLYYAQFQISAADLTNEIHNYGEDILNTSTDDVISTKGIYAKTDATVKAATFPYDVSQSIINANGNVFIFAPSNKSVYKFDSVSAIDTLKPANLLGALDANNNFQLTWDPTTADFYQVFYKTSDMSSAEPLTSGQLVDHQFTITQADYAQWAGKTVTFTVQSVIGSYTSAPVTFTYTFKPNTPTNFTVNKDTNNNLVFNWDSETADYYKLYYKTSTMADFLPIDDAQLVTNQTSLTETEYQQWVGQTVTFAVKAFAGDKVSDMATFDFLVEDTAPAPTETTNNTQTGTSTPSGDTSGGTVDGTTDGTVDDPTDLFNLDNVKIIRSITTYESLYEYKDDTTDNVALNLHESLINEMNQTGDEGFYIESNLGSFQIPIKTIDEFTNDTNSYVQVTIEKVPQDTADDISQIADDHFFELLSQPVDFSVQIVENGTSTTITSYGDQFVERRIPIDDPSDLDNMVVVLLDPITGTYQPVPTTIEQDENGQYWAVFYRNGNSIYALAKTEGTKFTDVENHWAKNNIEDLAAKMIVRGTGDNEFSPEKAVSRAEFATMLTRALGVVQEDSSQQSEFKDVNAENMYRKAITAASTSGLVKGYADGTFRPNDTINREEMTAMAVRALEWVNGNQTADPSQLSGFADQNKVDDWAKQSLAIAVDHGLIKGETPSSIAPRSTVTRAEAAVVIDRLLKSLKF
jgi:hypothetical protein